MCYLLSNRCENSSGMLEEREGRGDKGEGRGRGEGVEKGEGRGETVGERERKISRLMFLQGNQFDEWVDKSYLCQKACEASDCKLMFHKIVAFNSDLDNKQKQYPFILFYFILFYYFLMN